MGRYPILCVCSRKQKLLNRMRNRHLPIRLTNRLRKSCKRHSCHPLAILNKLINSRMESGRCSFRVMLIVMRAMRKKRWDLKS